MQWLFLLLVAFFQVSITLSINLHGVEGSRNIQRSSENYGSDLKETAIINGKNYFFSVVRGTLYDATQSCKELGMELVALETQEESEAVFSYVAQNHPNTQFYTSGVKLYEQYLWGSTGTWFGYANWALGQPNSPPYPQQACVIIAENYLWYSPCDYSFPFICENSTYC